MPSPGTKNAASTPAVPMCRSFFPDWAFLSNYPGDFWTREIVKSLSNFKKGWNASTKFDLQVQFWHSTKDGER